MAWLYQPKYWHFSNKTLKLPAAKSLLSSCSFQNMIFMASLLYLSAYIKDPRGKRWRELRWHMTQFLPALNLQCCVVSLRFEPGNVFIKRYFKRQKVAECYVQTLKANEVLQSKQIVTRWAVEKLLWVTVFSTNAGVHEWHAPKCTNACFPQRREGEFFSGLIWVLWSRLSSGQTFQFWREVTLPRQSISDGKVLSNMKNLMKPNTRGNKLSASDRESSGIHRSYPAKTLLCLSEAKIGVYGGIVLTSQDVSRSFSQVKLAIPHDK